MLSTAAVLGSGCDADLLRAVSGRGETETVEALDEAVHRFLLTEVPPAGGHGPPSYEFPYEALRAVVYDAATLARRRLLHGRAADTLARRYERDPAATRAAAVAEHLQRAGRDAEAADWWWRAAGRARELYAHAEEYAYLRKAEALGYPPVPVAVALGDAAHRARPVPGGAGRVRGRGGRGAGRGRRQPRGGHRAQAGRGAPPAG